MRTIHADTLTALSAGSFHPILMVHVDWPDGVVYAHTGFGNISWDGHTWAGVGPWGGADIPDEVADTAVPSEMVLHILGTLDDIDAAMAQAARNRDVDVYFALVTERQGNVLVGEPVPLMIGYIDSNDSAYSQVSESEFVPEFSLGVNSGPSVRMKLSASHSTEDQQTTYATDTIFDHAVYEALQRQNPEIWP
ncbi:hypothetical protein Q4525_14770 [Shimia thalassica]|uniref:hypothetical protein n=1 Tax=Shimia thalassica TaxID=1715693 RepID=UPI001C09D3A2|nr:hypothetical protein [Shimia thalassica]MBU2941073.1 hypothetical protein [Shimia thalassica]MDO6504200.1 hypothetical protein [Shimia thalassica]